MTGFCFHHITWQAVRSDHWITDGIDECFHCGATIEVRP